MLLAALAAVLAAAGATAAPDLAWGTVARPPAPQRPAALVPARSVFFMGNSIVYWHDLPGVLNRLAPNLHTQLRVRPGATLSQLEPAGLADIAAAPALDVLVLQEHGGDVLCLAPGADARDDECVAMIDVHVRLAKAAQARGARTLVMGTYQPNSLVSSRMASSEQALAMRINALAVPFSESFKRGMEARPDLAWLDADGGHPGPAGTVMMAAVLAHRINGAWPDAQRLRMCRYSPVEPVTPDAGAATLRAVESKTCTELDAPDVAAIIGFSKTLPAD